MSGPRPEFSVVHMVESPSPRARASLSPDMMHWRPSTTEASSALAAHGPRLTESARVLQSAAWWLGMQHLNTKLSSILCPFPVTLSSSSVFCSL